MKKSLLLILISLLFFNQAFYAQARVHYNGQDLFMNGSNVAWVNFSRDIGPGTTNFTKFAEIFAELKADGGNCFRFWLHTDGTTTPAFNGSGLVSGPGAGAIDDLKQILDLAWQNKISLMLCLWSHDMLRTSLSSSVLDRNQKLLTDTSAISAYINNSLLPMVQAVKGHPAILAWEIFNEPEGFTEIGDWSDRRKVRQFDVQRFVNLTAGAIHRADPSARVTNGTWGMQALTDVFTVSKSSAANFYNSLSEDQKADIEKEFKTKYNLDYSAKEIINKFYGTAAQNTNYYRDDRLVAAGGDPDGKLDFYTVHYYSWAGTALSPFHNSYSFWNLDKPLVIAEFFMQNSFGVASEDLYRTLYNTGYAGALSWHWNGDTQEHDNAKDWNHERSAAAIRDIFENYPNEVVIDPVPGTIYVFKSDKDTIETGDTLSLKWRASIGSNAALDGTALPDTGSMKVVPDTSRSYSIITDSAVKDTSTLSVKVLYPGTILSYSIFPRVVTSGEKVTIKWKTTRNSTVKLNDIPVAEDDSVKMIVNGTTSFNLSAEGVVSTAESITVEVLPVSEINRALDRTASASSGTTPQNIADGNFGSTWNTSATTSSWVQINLEQYYVINKVVIKWGLVYATDFSLSNYKLPMLNPVIYRDQAGKGGIDTIDLKDTVRALRLNLLQSSGTGYSVRELEIYGVPVETTGISDPGLINGYSLAQNYPNPFNPSSLISYQILHGGNVSLKVYDILGNEVQTLVSGFKPAGKYEVTFDGSNFASGTYIYRLIVNDYVSARKMMLVK